MSLHNDAIDDLTSDENEPHRSTQTGLSNDKKPFTEADYDFMREETKKMLVNRFRISEEKAAERAELEIRFLKETFRKMPEFAKN